MEFPLHPSPCARIRHRMSSLDCVPMPRDFRVSILHRERMKRKEERRRIEGRGCSKGTDFFSRSRSARPELSTNFSLVRIFANGPRSSSQFQRVSRGNSNASINKSAVDRFCEQVSLDLRFFIHTRFYCTKLLSFETLY